MLCFCTSPGKDEDERCCSSCYEKATCHWLCSYLDGSADECLNFLQKEREARMPIDPECT
jgi:hypothetical protein